MVNIPGSNLLNQALRVIAKQTFQYYGWQSRALNSVGKWVNTYTAPVTITGSVQPVARHLYEQLGLQLDKNYINVYTPNSIIDVDRDRSSDQISFNGQAYQVLANTQWYGVDGWTATLCVGIPALG